ncbi:MAG: 4Fe-4S binding protein [Muribaculaceae bacterium]|nr:4Fe-4S binding protein [Muribaculaceae bacterium]
MYKSIRIIRILLALVTMTLPTWALVAGYDSVFRNMQILTALLSGSLLCLVFWLVATLIYGRIYCSVVCPLGTAMDCIAAAERTLSRRRRNFRYTPPRNAVRIVFLAIAVLMILVGGPMLPTLLDPYTEYARMVEEFLVRPFGRNADGVRFCLSAFAVASFILVSLLGFSWKHGRILCNTVCPVGTVLAMCSRRSVFHPDINTDKCINCGECERVCKAGCIRLTDHVVDIDRCVVCFDCMAVCPSDAITYRQGRHRLGMPMMQATSGPQNLSAPAQDAPQQPIKETQNNETVS